MSPKVMASFSAFGGDLPSIAFIVLHSLEGSVLWSRCLHELSPCVSSMFVCSSGDLVVHLLQGWRGWISRSEVVSCSHLFQYFRWNWFRINTVSSRGYMSRCCFQNDGTQDLFSFFGSLMEAVFFSVYPLSPYYIGPSLLSLS